MAFLGIGKKKMKSLPPLGMPPMPPAELTKQRFPEMPSFPELPPLPEMPTFEDKPKNAQTLKPVMEIGQSPTKEPEDMPMDDFPNMPELPPIPEYEPEQENTNATEYTKLEEMPPFEEEKKEYSRIKPLFIKSTDYKAILSGINTVKNRIRETERIMEEIDNIKKEKAKQFEEWRNLLEDIQRKLVYVDKQVFEV